MKNTLWMAAVAATILVAGSGCGKQHLSGIYPDPNANCWVFVTTTPGQEVILLAKSSLTEESAFAIYDEFKVKYGNDNTIWRISFPGGINNLELDRFEIEADAITNCYEHTITVDFPGTTIPSAQSLINYGFCSVRINGSTAVCKEYFWAYTEEGAKLSQEFLVNSEKKYRLGHGEVKNSEIKCLGPEIENMPVIF